MLGNNKPLSGILYPHKATEKVLKRSLSGQEIEMFILDGEGRIDESDQLLIQSAKRNLAAKKESHLGMIEMNCLPFSKLSATTQDMLKNLESLSELAESLGKHLYPFGAYPGKYAPKVREHHRYDVQKVIFGKDRYTKMFTCGYHQHYTLPRGLYDKKNKTLKYMKKSRVKRTLVDSYNLIIAADPICTTFMQSSPFSNGEHKMNDHRLVFQRGSRIFGNNPSIYQSKQLFGQLPPYKQTLRDLISVAAKKYNRWGHMLQKHGFDPEKEMKNTTPFDYAWNPVRVNSKGTIEYRGCDMNLPSYMLSTATLIQFSQRKIQRDFLWVVPADIDETESFKIEGNAIFIPPHTYVRNQLQKDAAFEGFASKRVHEYARRFCKFVRQVTPKKYYPLIRPLQEMIESKKTMADNMISYAKRKGYDVTLSDELSQELSLHFAGLLKKDLNRSLELLQKAE